MTFILAELTKRLTTGEPEHQIEVLDELRAAVRDKQPLPLDEILALLRERGAWGPDAEKSREVRQAIYDAMRTVAAARGRQRGLRGSISKVRDFVDELEDRALLWASIEYVWDAVSIYDGIEIFEAGLALATERQRHFYAIWWTVSEVNNGGFNQYFWNPTGIVAPVALQGMVALGEDRAASALAAASSPFGARIADHRHRQKVLKGLPRDVFEAQDNLFYETAPELFRRAAAYIRAHLGEFFE